MEKIKKNLEERSKKSISVLKEDLNTVRAGRANPSLLDKVMVEYYGTPTPLKNLANIAVPDPRTLLITPFDPKAISEIEKGINIANMNLCRDRRGGSAIMVIETDEKVPPVVMQFLKEYTGISHITYYEKED